MLFDSADIKLNWRHDVLAPVLSNPYEAAPPPGGGGESKWSDRAAGAGAAGAGGAGAAGGGGAGAGGAAWAAGGSTADGAWSPSQAKAIEAYKKAVAEKLAEAEDQRLLSAALGQVVKRPMGISSKDARVALSSDPRFQVWFGGKDFWFALSSSSSLPLPVVTNGAGGGGGGGGGAAAGAAAGGGAGGAAAGGDSGGGRGSVTTDVSVGRSSVPPMPSIGTLGMLTLSRDVSAISIEAEEGRFSVLLNSILKLSMTRGGPTAWVVDAAVAHTFYKESGGSAALKERYKSLRQDAFSGGLVNVGFWNAEGEVCALETAGGNSDISMPEWVHPRKTQLFLKLTSAGRRVLEEDVPDDEEGL